MAPMCPHVTHASFGPSKSATQTVSDTEDLGVTPLGHPTGAPYTIVLEKIETESKNRIYITG